MRTLIGVDFHDGYHAAADLVRRLDFVDNEVELLHAADVHTAVIGVAPVLDMGSTAYAEVSEVCENLLDGARHFVKDLGLPVTATLALGAAHSELLARSEEIEADLIAVGPSHKTAVERFFLGSTTKGIAHDSHVPVLIARETQYTGPVTAILATDHADYGERCLRRFMQMVPRGIDRLIVLHVAPGNLYNGVRPEPCAAEVKTANNRLVARLQAAGFAAESLVLSGEPNDAIEHAMKETGAELLILGAHSHGFFHRLLNSVSEKQVVLAHHSLLLLRIPTAI